MYVVSVLVAGLFLLLSSAALYAQDFVSDDELTLEELQEKRELLAQEAAAAAASIDVSTASVEEIEQALDEMAALTQIQQIRLEEATDRYDSAVDGYNRAQQDYDEVLAVIEEQRQFIADLSLAAFTGESGPGSFELAMSADPGESARFTHLLELQTGDVGDSLDRLRLLEFEAEELLAERESASRRAQESVAEIEFRSAELVAAITEQETLLRAAEIRLTAEEDEAGGLSERSEALEELIADIEERIADAVRGVGSPAAVNRADIVTLSFYEGGSSVPIFQIQVHRDIEEQTRGLYELAFSQGINLGGWGYRTTQRQIELRAAHCGSSDYDIWLRPASQCSPPTARPGYSLHEQGRAIDFQWNGGSIGPRSGPAFQWLAANAPQFGFVNLPSEPWHWSDGSGVRFDPNVPIPDIPDDAVGEAEPDAETAELLSELVDPDPDAEVDDEVVIELGADADEVENADADADAEEGDDGAEGTAPEALASTDDEETTPEPNPETEAADADTTEPAGEEPAAEEPANEEPAAEEATAPEPEPAETEAPAEQADSSEPVTDG